MWAQQISAFSASHRVIAWDAPGCGASSDPPEGFTLADYSRCLGGLLDALSVTDAHIVGLSWGGALAIGFAAMFPHKTRSMALADTYLGWLGSFGKEVAQERLQTCVQDSYLSGGALADKWVAGLVGPQTKTDVTARIKEILSDFHPPGFRNHAKTLAESDLRGELRRFDKPLLLVWGEQDARSPLSVAAAFQKLAPGARLVTVANAGHLPNLERPERFNEALRAFLAS
jgi:pimeloyl-ACP methyl ester carboxylesterase